MTVYDFDEPIDRHGTDCLKFDRAESRHRSADLLSLWVADMDFRAPQPAIDALAERSRHGIFGYTEPGDAYYAAVGNWMETRHNWHVEPEWFVHTPGIVGALALCVQAFTRPGDAVLVQQPVYYPFSEVIANNGRTVANAALVYGNGRYEIDFDAFERTLTEYGAKLFLLCNPHNPGGRVWTAEELRRLGEICNAHDVLVVSDEIHMDFAQPGFAHTAYASLGSKFADRCIVCTSAGKTFNLAGLQTSNIIVPNPQLRRTLRAQVSKSGYSQPNTMGVVATQACYEQGGEWLDQLKAYLAGNIELVESHLGTAAPELKVMRPESTYLVWVDARELGLYGKDLVRFIEDEAGLWLDCGDMFGKDGDGFIRINVATQRAYLQKALDQLIAAVERRRVRG